MKVLALTHIFPSLSAPTRGPYNHNIFKAIARHCEVRVIVPEPWWGRVRCPQKLWKTPYEEQTGLPAIFPTFWSVPRMAPLHGRALYLSLRTSIARLRRDFPFDAILAAWAYPDAVAAEKIAREFGCPLVIKVLGSDVNALTRSAPLRTQIVQSMQAAHCTIAVSEALRERLVEIGVPRERTLVQHNGVDGDRFTLRERNAARAQLGLSPQAPMLCYVGRLGHEKGLDILLQAMHRLKTSGRTDIELKLVGWGECEDTLRTQARELQLEKQVAFCGRRSHDEVPLWVSACDVLCLPSRREGCPNVVLEALASGRPVVASRVGGVP